MAGWAPTFSWLTETLAVGGAVPIEHVPNLAAEHSVAAVIDLRDEACDEAEVLQGHGLDFLHLPTEDLCAVSAEMLDEGVAFARPRLAAGRRILIHCQHGIGRSATLALCVLVDQGLEPLAALSLAKDRRPLVSPSPAQYEAWAAWMARRRPPPPIPDFDAFKAIAYRHLQAQA
jgi:protein-tyrosine phosphatase